MFPMTMTMTMKSTPVSCRLSGRFHACRFMFALPLAAGLIAASVWLFANLPRSDLPEQDTGVIGAFIRVFCG